MHTQFHRSSGLILLRIVWGVLGIGATIPLVGLWSNIARTEKRIERPADQDYFQKQIEKVRRAGGARDVGKAGQHRRSRWASDGIIVINRGLSPIVLFNSTNSWADIVGGESTRISKVVDRRSFSGILAWRRSSIKDF